MKRSKEDESTIVKRVSVRLLLEHERPEFDRLLEERHYLKSARLSGQTLRYVAELDGVWVALVCFGAAALHLKAREQHLGWSPRQRARRLIKNLSLYAYAIKNLSLYAPSAKNSTPPKPITPAPNYASNTSL